MIRADIQLQAETADDLSYVLRLLASSIEGSCKLDEPEGEHKYGDDLDPSIIIATFKVLPEYRKGDLEKFVGCDPDFTGALTTEEYINRIRGRYDDSSADMAFSVEELWATVPGCGCRRCLDGRGERINGRPATRMMMIVCGTCGNKRCPHATDHRNECTNSNESGQPGSVYV